MNKLFIETLGCPKNFNDSEGIAGIWERAGLTVTQSVEEADVILVNTCGFINDAKTESIDCIFDMIRFIHDKSQGKTPAKRYPLLVVSGCLSERYAEDMFLEIPEVDIFMGVNDYERLPEIVASHDNRCIYNSAAPEKFEEFSSRRLNDNPYSATLRIAEGCNNCCTYCVIPLIRGGYRSRPMENIIAEAERMAASGTREIILIAQDVTEYGYDLYGQLRLSELLRKLCEIDGLKWIRLMYCYEDKITDELIETMAAEGKICKYIDIPLQHVSDNVLSGMGRRSTAKSIRETIGRLREAMPDIHIRTTFITGFPGETEEEFAELVDFAEAYKLERLGVFPYSREEGTPAYDMSGQIEEEEKTARAESIMRRQVEVSRKVNEAKIGKVITVLVEGMDEEGAYMGRSEYDAPEIDGNVIFIDDTGRGELKPGDFAEVAIEDAFDYDLAGRRV